MCLALKDLKAACSCEPKSTGIATAYIIPECDIETDGDKYSLTDAPAIGDLGTMYTPIVPVAGKGFIEFPFQLHKNSLKFESQGENGTGNIKTMLEALVPGFDKDLIGTLNQMRYSAVRIIVELTNGSRFVIGSKNLPAYLTFNGDTLTTDATDAAGFTITAEGISSYICCYADGLAITPQP